MIHVTYHRTYNRLTVEGHAGSAEPGYDLVCSGASILAYTLADRVAHLSQSGQVRGPVIRLEPGDTEISCNPSHKYKASVTLIFDTVCAGFQLLAADYPEYVQFEIRQG